MTNYSSDVYINAMGVFLPGSPIANEAMEDYLGRIHGKKSSLKSKILAQNGIKTRYYALDLAQETTMQNAELAAKAAREALAKGNLNPELIELLAVGTTQGDLPVPGFGSMVHAELQELKTCEVSSSQSVCASGMMALQNSLAQIKSGLKSNALCIGSELASRLFKASRFEGQKVNSLSFNTEFLRWMLSDGAGAFLLQNKPNLKGLSLKIHWIDIQSHAHERPLCMYVGKTDNRNEEEKSWLDYPDYESASAAGALNLHQDVRLLDQVVKTGVQHLFELIDRGWISSKEIQWLCCHYSSEMFKPSIKELLTKGGLDIPDEKWFTNLHSRGNTGSASIFIMLEELFYSGKLKVGDNILCMVPESGRFITSYMRLEVVGNEELTKSYPIRPPEAPALQIEPNPVSEFLIRQLSKIWIQFETDLLQVPIVQKIHQGKLTLEEYKLLLLDLRQQVIDGSQWISRAASHIDIELFELRSAFIRHTAAEHKDYQILEKNYEALGENILDMYGRKKNIGSIALTSFMFQQAGKPNPIDLLGAMFIIEGIGKRLAAYWGNMIKEQLGLREDQVSFFTYHGVADENHFHNLEQALNHPAMTQEIAERIATTAKVTAHLYKHQLLELGNY